MKAATSLLAASLLALTAGCAGVPQAAAAPTTPIKIGVMFPLSGPFAANGQANVNGIRLAFDEAGNRVAGRQIQLLTEDDEGKSDVGLTKIKSLVERDRADILISVIVSPEAGAVAPYVSQAKVPWVTTASLIALTRKLHSPYVFRMSPSSYSYGLVAADWAKKQHWKRIDYIGSDYAPAHESFDAVKHVYGNDVAAALFPPVGTPDYSPYLTRIDPSKANGALVAIWGSDAPRVAHQYAEYGLKAKLPFFGVASFTAEEGLNDMPPEVEGAYSGYVYCGTLSTPENKRFVSNYEARFKSTPGPFAYLAYVAAESVIAAIKDTGGRVDDKPKLLAALDKVHVKGPMGDVSFDNRNGMVGNFYILKVVRRNGHLENQCVERIANVKDPYNLFP